MGSSYRERHTTPATTTSHNLEGLGTGTNSDTTGAYDNHTLAELRELAEARGLKSYGSKADIAARLTDDDNA